MTKLIRPLVLVHGLWDTPRLFNAFINTISQDQSVIFTPDLPHILGRTSLNKLAYELDIQINARF